MSKNTKTKKWFYLVLIAIPIIFFILLELFLRIFEYGEDYSTFVVIEEISSNQYFFNPKFPEKYFTNSETIPSVIPDPFDKEKAENTIRIFAFGGSTTAGYPYSPNASFPRIIKNKLEMFYPTHKIEVINLGVSAVNTYFIKDILPDVLSHKPDLLLFYSGHNEFYGALGPASTEYISGNTFIINLTLTFRETKIYQLLRNIISSVSESIISEKNISRNTLMESMINEQDVSLDSEIYKKGIEQYRNNLSEILNKCIDNNVPVIIGNLVSNLKQKPLGRKSSLAYQYYETAEKYLLDGDSILAREEFIKAKDNDLIKFRATEDFNLIIDDLSDELNFKVVNLQNGFYKKSSNSIIGYELMVDHLHPNLTGYNLMADIFYAEVDEQLKKKFRKELKVNPDAVNKYLEDNFPFTRYDSTLADIKIQLLLNSLPFTNAEYKLSSYKLNNFADSTAMLTIQGELGWAAAHLKLFDFYFEEDQYEKAIKEIFSLMEDRPFYKSALQYAILKIIKAGYVRDAKHILVRNHKRYPDGFTSKNLGIINLNEGNNKLANDLLNEAVKFNNRDAEAYFHLSRSYFFMNDLESAVSAIEKCLLLNPDYKGAEEIHNRLIKMKKSN